MVLVRNGTMPVRLFYIDESHNEDVFCLSAIAVWDSDWRECFGLIRDHRRLLKKEHSLFVSKEIHARDLVAGRGRLCPDGMILTKWERSRIFYGMLRLVAQLPRVKVFNVCL